MILGKLNCFALFAQGTSRISYICNYIFILSNQNDIGRASCAISNTICIVAFFGTSQFFPHLY